MDEKEFVSLYDSGDRTIIVGEKEAGQYLYKVSSLAMSMASPVWRAMFNPVSGFRESNPDVAVEFTEDDPDVLLILLRIAHLQFHHLPKSISFAWLMELAVLCDKYDTVGLVQPFIENWMSPWTLLCLEAGYEDWLFIAWTFGCQKIFSLLAASLVLSIEVGSDDNILNSGNEVLGDHMPLQIIETILTVREETITKLLDLCHDTIENLIKRLYCMGNHSYNSCLSSDGCNTAMLGLFVRALYPLGLGSQKVPAKEVKTSISKFTQRLNHSPGAIAYGVYKSCDLATRLLPKFKEILDQIPSAVTEHHKRHMEEQAKKSGIGDLKVPDANQTCVVM